MNKSQIRIISFRKIKTLGLYIKITIQEANMIIVYIKINMINLEISFINTYKIN